MLETTIVGSLPKPSWLAKPGVLWAPWALEGAALEEAQRDAVLVALKEQEAAGIDIITDGEQVRQHFVHGFLAGLSGIDFNKRRVIAIRADRYKAECPTVTGPIRRTHSVHKDGVAFAVQHTTRKFKFTLPGPMTIVDTVADEYYRDRVKMALALAEALNEEALELERCGVHTIQFDEPAFNVYLDDVREWGIAALERAAQGLKCKTAVHICYGYGIKANTDWKESLGGEWRQYEKTFPHLAASKIDQVSLECMHSRVPMSLLGLLKGKDVQVGVIDVASNNVETPEEVAAVLRDALKYVPVERLLASTNCGMAPMPRSVAYAKLRAIAGGAALLRKELGMRTDD
jgi:5-methyltetrahydropteroyltriglutamate--homocysteine methyltransferase